MKQEKYGFIYIWRDKKHHRYYIGSRWGHINDGYICSSKWMKENYQRRPGDFKRRILETNIPKMELLDREQRWLDMIKPEERSIRYYNQMLVAKYGMHGKSMSDETKRKIGEANRGRSPWSKGKRLTDPKYCRPMPEHVKENLRQINSRPCSEEKKAKIAASLRGKKHTLERRMKISIGNRKPKPKVSEALKGRVMPIEHRLSIKEAQLRRFEEMRNWDRSYANADDHVLPFYVIDDVSTEEFF